jgi:hypothetical protein
MACRKVDLIYHQLDENGNFIDNWPASYDMTTMQTT